MPGDLREVTKVKTPEEEELSQKQNELSAIGTELEHKELDLATLKATLLSFEQRYVHIVGKRYAELDRINAEIAEIIAEQKGDDKESQEQARSARAKANETERLVFSDQFKEGRARIFFPSAELKKLYRQVAREIHPDLSVDQRECARRHEFMAKANKAFAEGDEETLRRILEEWETSPEAVEGAGTAAELVRVIRKIAQARKRLDAISKEFDEIKTSDLYLLFKRVSNAEKTGRNLLAEMAEIVDEEIFEARNHLQKMKTRGAT